MKTLSIRQPWAWLIINTINGEYKNIENRTWPTPFKGRFLIHSSQKFDWNGYLWLKNNMPEIAIAVEKHFSIDLILQRNKHGHLKKICRSGEFGGIIGSIELIDCVTTSDSKWFFGPYGFVLKNPIPMDYIPLKGKLRFFEGTGPVHLEESTDVLSRSSARQDDGLR